MEALLYATPIGLALDILGFLIVVNYGHALFIRSGGRPDHSKGKDGDLWFGDGSNKGESEESKRRRFWAKVGVGIVVFGFGLQIVGAMGVIL